LWDWLSSANDVSVERKQAMLAALDKPAKKQKTKRLQGKGLAASIGNMELDNFVTEQSKELFNELKTQPL